jgi:hypothetical protein
MGFKHQPRTYRLVFDDPALEGLEVAARGMSIGELNDPDKKLYASFADALVEWNLEYKDGTPVPTTREAIEAYPDLDFMQGLANTWLNAVMGVDEDLGKDSTSGDTFPEASIPMEVLSPSLVS